MNEGLAVMASNHTMAIRDIYETCFVKMSDKKSNNQCPPECDGRVTTNSVKTVCEDCGLVIEESRIDQGPEWRAYDEDQRKRTGAPLTAARHDRGLSTEIGRWKDANGNELSGQKRQRLSRMRQEQNRGRFQSKAERNLAHGLGEVRRMASALELSDSVRDQACQLFRALKLKTCFEADPSKPSPRPACAGPAAVIGSPGCWTRSLRWPASRNLESRTRTKR